MVILLNVWILPIGGVASGRVWINGATPSGLLFSAISQFQGGLLTTIYIREGLGYNIHCQ